MNFKILRLLTIGALLTAGTFLSTASGQSPRQKINIDFDWKFHLGDVRDGEKTAPEDHGREGVYEMMSCNILFKMLKIKNLIVYLQPAKVYCGK